MKKEKLDKALRYAFFGLMGLAYLYFLIMIVLSF